jgi:hypothetical protein
MKYIILLLSLNILGCKKNEKLDTNCFNVKTVTSFCGVVVLQIQDPAFEYLGVDGWYNPIDKKTYDNVFLLKNYCDNIGVDGKDVFKVKLKNESTINNNCIVCLAIFPGATPTAALAVSTCE